LRTDVAAARRLIRRLAANWPLLEGAPIGVRFRPSLWVSRGRLAKPPSGVEVHAATFVRRRQVMLEAALLRHPSELARILIHELFHFAWVRLGNARRRSWEQLVAEESRCGARGELGYSAERRKLSLSRRDLQARTRRWREYVCESFCDSAAWLFTPRSRHEEFTLAIRWRRRRKRWLKQLMAHGPLPV